MEDSPYGNAMTEVALALAMAFFSIMVLTTVSMSATPETEYSRSQKNEEMEFSNTTKETIEKTNQKRKLIIFWTGQFLDKNLKAVDINEIKPDVPIVLCHSCNHFFHEEDWEFATMSKSHCPFCRTSIDGMDGGACSGSFPRIGGARASGGATGGGGAADMMSIQ